MLEFIELSVAQGMFSYISTAFIIKIKKSNSFIKHRTPYIYKTQKHPSRGDSNLKKNK